jgi:aspartyl-tRNA(Asn)/glutamyl-tRNA(Gln) amidotransferase subunit A
MDTTHISTGIAAMKPRPFLSIAQAAEQLRHGEITPTALIQAYLDRIEQLEPRLNSFITVLSDSAMEQARQAETELNAGKDRGPLHGIPVVIKDLFAVQDAPTSAGSRIFGSIPSTLDSSVIARLRQAGAIFLGKTNMHEWAMGVINDNPHYGSTYNPWDTTRSPGGSSGGNGVALAADLAMGGLGSDTRGSVRIPAALCGIVGLKPTYGRISLDGVVPLSWSLDHAGTMARTVRDAAILLQYSAGYDSHDVYAVNIPVPDYLSNLENSVQGWRVGVPQEGDFFYEADPEIIAAFQAAVSTFESLGAVIEPIAPQFLRQSFELSRVIVSADGAAFHQERLAKQSAAFGADVLGRLRAGEQMSAVEYALARHGQKVMTDQLDAMFNYQRLDFIITPTTPITAPRYDQGMEIERARASLTTFTTPFNMTRHPAISVPCGFNQQGLPIGLQVVARHWDEARLLTAAHAYEQATSWHNRHPSL